MSGHLDGSVSDLTSDFSRRHIGPSTEEQQQMLALLGCASLDQLTDKVVPAQIKLGSLLPLGEYAAPRSEVAVLERLRTIMRGNAVLRSFIGAGYYGTNPPAVIVRNILENPGWYTQYTPYQAEIAQGRLEALLNYQTMVSDLTGLPVANASMLDEATAAAEAMTLSLAAWKKGDDESAAKSPVFFVSTECHPQTIATIQTRAWPLGISVVVGDHRTFTFTDSTFGALLQYPTSTGAVLDYREFVAAAHTAGALVTFAADILSLLLLTPPGELEADIAVGNTQRFGVPMGYGGPHAAYFSVKDEFKRLMPGRLIGVSKDSAGKPAMRLSLQTREQHIRREKATSNICTAQVLLAIMSSMYAVYHGPRGLRGIAERVHNLTRLLGGGLKQAGCKLESEVVFDSLLVLLSASERDAVIARALAAGINLRVHERGVGISLDETVTEQTVLELLQIVGGTKAPRSLAEIQPLLSVAPSLKRSSAVLSHPVFNSYHSETEFLRYIKRLEAKDLSLAHSMIPLGSCTMKLNATTEMVPVTWPEVSQLHPFVPTTQAQGFAQLFRELEGMLCAVTGFDAVSLQPNAGSQGEYAGLLAIKGFHESRGDHKRTICLIPKSAHGTNPASAAMAGMRVVVVDCDPAGNIDTADLKAKVEQHKAELAALMVTYPSTHGVFEESIRELCDAVHAAGGQVYMDGANTNALVGVCRPVDIGADVCHINLHKTFCIPHGGGGPGMGPIGVRAHLAPFLPTHPLVNNGVAANKAHTVGPVSAAPWGSASILVISWAYIAMMGAEGVRKATQVAILNANYVSKLLEPHYPTLYRGKGGFVAHECIVDPRELKKTAGVEVEDIAKRLMDYGFHAPTVAFPVIGTLMIEPTESESKGELDRFCDAMIQIREEIRRIEQGTLDKSNNMLKHAPHTAAVVTASEWTRPYSREEAAFPTPATRESKFWPSVGRVDGNYGDRNLVCTCLPIEAYVGR